MRDRLGDPRSRKAALRQILLSLPLMAFAELALAAETPPGPLCPRTLPLPYLSPDVSPAGSAYIPLDSWVYPALLRLYSLGYGAGNFSSLRPWTRQGALQWLETATPAVLEGQDEQATGLMDALLAELRREAARELHPGCTVAGVDSAYTRMLLLRGTPLADSYHLGQTFANDYGRPYQAGVSTLTGGSLLLERRRWSLFARGEHQHTPATAGYSPEMTAELSGNTDWITPTGPNLHQATLPAGPLPALDVFRLVEATASFHLLGHELSGGKTDTWLGPAEGGALLWSNNAADLYGVRLDRVEPLAVPLLSRLLGPLRYGILYGSLKGHTAPNSPYVHAEFFAFQPTSNFEFSFGRTVLFGGAGHEPVTLHTFAHSFVSLSDTSPAIKNSPQDPGARFSEFSFNWRLPGLRRYLTFYTDSFSHDDVTPISAPRRAAFRTGLYLAQMPGARRLSLRAEAAVTDPRVTVSYGGRFLYFESVQRQGYTNEGFLFGDPMGREAKGGQFTATWHLGGDEEVSATWLTKKNARDFILGGTTQNQAQVQLRKRLTRTVELLTMAQWEGWKAPVLSKDTGLALYRTGPQQDVAARFGLTWYPVAGVR